MVFITAMATMEGLSWDDYLDRLQKLYLPILLINWQVRLLSMHAQGTGFDEDEQIWPIIQTLNFRFLPLKYRVPFTASCGVLWTVWLS